MRYFLTGITGLLGNNIARHIIDRGDEVVALVRPGSDTAPLEGLPIQRVYGNLHDTGILNRACQQANAVIHAAGFVKIGWRGIEQATGTNVKGVRNIARAARAADIPMVHVSTVNALALGTEHKPATETTPLTYSTQCPYVVSKRAGDAVIAAEVAHGLRASIVYPGFMLGPWDWKPSSGEMLLQVHRQFTPVAPRGGVSVCDVRDVAAGIITAVAKAAPGDRFILAGENLSYLAIWKLMAEVSGSMAPFSRTGPMLPYLAGMAGDLVTMLRGEEGSINSAAAEMSGQLHYYNSDHAMETLGYKSRKPAESIQDAWEWFVEYGFTGHSQPPTYQAA